MEVEDFGKLKSESDIDIRNQKPFLKRGGRHKRIAPYIYYESIHTIQQQVFRMRTDTAQIRILVKNSPNREIEKQSHWERPPESFGGRRQDKFEAIEVKWLLITFMDSGYAGTFPIGPG